MAKVHFLQIALTTKCNLSCWHCPMKEYRNTTPNFPLKNSELIPWLEMFIEPNKWVIELTGGEPALYEGIDELCQWLSERNYTVIIKTNGMLEIKSYPNIKRVAAFHQVVRPPKYFDEILIVDKLDRQKKEEICKENGWIYHVIGYNSDTIDDFKNPFKYIAFINAAGHQYKCCAMQPIQKVIDGVDYNRIDHRQLEVFDCCEDCKGAIDCARFL